MKERRFGNTGVIMKGVEEIYDKYLREIIHPEW